MFNALPERKAGTRYLRGFLTDCFFEKNPNLRRTL